MILKLRDDLIKAREIIKQEQEIKKKLLEYIRQIRNQSCAANDQNKHSITKKDALTVQAETSSEDDIDLSAEEEQRLERKRINE